MRRLPLVLLVLAGCNDKAESPPLIADAGGAADVAVGADSGTDCDARSDGDLPPADAPPDAITRDADGRDDAVAACRPASGELCDGVDNDCDGLTDEDLLTRYYQDCDADLYPPLVAQTQDVCVRPVAGPTACPSGGWTTIAPVAGSTADCRDDLATVGPGDKLWHDGAIPDAPGDHDWNCDGDQQRGYTNDTGACLLRGTTCSGYWTAGAIVACGDSGSFQDCESTIINAALACVVKGAPANRSQECR